MKEDEIITSEEMFGQLAIIKDRLETYPLANHEVVCLKDCMLLLIRTFAGERIPELQLARVGGGIMETGNQNGLSEYIGGEMRAGGIEIAPGVVQYPAAPNTATIDVEASQRELNTSLKPAKAPPPDMPKPVAGSLMAMALANEGKADVPESSKPESTQLSQGEQEAIAQIQEQTKDVPQGIPTPSDTRVEITS